MSICLPLPFLTPRMHLLLFSAQFFILVSCHWHIVPCGDTEGLSRHVLRRKNNSENLGYPIHSDSQLFTCPTFPPFYLFSRFSVEKSNQSALWYIDMVKLWRISMRSLAPFHTNIPTMASPTARLSPSSLPRSTELTCLSPSASAISACLVTSLMSDTVLWRVSCLSVCTSLLHCLRTRALAIY